MAVIDKPSQFRLAWIGPDDRTCRYLLDRITSECQAQALQATVFKAHRLELDRLPDQDRLILVSANRSDYPHEAVDSLTTTDNIVPWGVVTSSWHCGSRRSGDGPVTHWQQPWFRWWDSWIGWIFPQVIRPASRVVNAFSPIVTSLDYAQAGHVQPSPITDQAIAIVCACANTAGMLSAQAHHVGWRTQLIESLKQFSIDERDQPDMVLWDDSMLPCLPSLDLSTVIDKQFRSLLTQVPATQLVVSLGLEHLDLWPRIQSYGCPDILVKPSYALALSNLLSHRTAQRQVA